MNLTLDLDASRATVRIAGYLSPQSSTNLAVLLADLGRMEVTEIELDLSAASPICVAALERLLEVKFELAERGVALRFTHPTSAVSKVFRIMGLHPDGELPWMQPADDPGN